METFSIFRAPSPNPSSTASSPLSQPPSCEISSNVFHPHSTQRNNNSYHNLHPEHNPSILKWIFYILLPTHQQLQFQPDFVRQQQTVWQPGSFQPPPHQAVEQRQLPETLIGGVEFGLQDSHGSQITSSSMLTFRNVCWSVLQS